MSEISETVVLPQPHPLTRVDLYRVLRPFERGVKLARAITRLVRAVAPPRTRARSSASALRSARTQRSRKPSADPEPAATRQRPLTAVSTAALTPAWNQKGGVADARCS